MWTGIVTGGAAETLLMADAELVAETLPPAASLAGLVARAQAGDGDAFEALMVSTQRRVAGVALRILGNRDDAGDATQEVYLRVYRFLATFRAGQDFHSWLYRITVNACRDLHRKRRRSADWEALPVEPAGPHDLEADALASERRELLMKALGTLPEKERLALVLRDLEGHSTEEVARMLGSRAGTVRSRVCTARGRIRRMFHEVFGARRGGNA